MDRVVTGEGLSLLTWAQDSFAYAESYDESAGRYRGLQTARQVWVDGENPIGLLVKPEAAQRQLLAEVPSTGVGQSTRTSGGTTPAPTTETIGDTQPVAIATGPKRFHGTVLLDSKRVGRDAGRIADEVIAHLSGLLGARMRISLEIEAEVPAGVPDHVVRTVTENCRTLKFDSQGFEKE